MTEIVINDNYGLVPHVAQVLLLAEGIAWSLPHHSYDEVPEINRHDRVGCPGWIASVS